MEKENCVNCGRFLGSYEAEAKQDYGDVKKGDIVELHGCKHCEDFTIEGIRRK